MIEYPFIDTFEAKSGLVIRVRPLELDDTPFLVDLFEHMGTESRYNRFLQPVDNIGIDRIWTEAENIAQLVAGASFGLVAFADLPEQPKALVGAARFVKMDSTQAELAISVRDDMHSQGIGANLLRLLIRHATADGIEQLVGTVQNSNTAMWAMLKKSGYRLERRLEGNCTLITLHINEPPHRSEEWLDEAADFSMESQIVW